MQVCELKIKLSKFVHTKAYYLFCNTTSRTNNQSFYLIDVDAIIDCEICLF